MRYNGNNVVRGRFSERPRRASWGSIDAYRPAPARRRRWKTWTAYLPLWVAAAGGGALYGAGVFDRLTAPGEYPAEPRAGIRASFAYCHTGGGYNCVVDGDTIWLKGSKIRIADIDAPETHDYRCASEKALGDRATRRLHELLESGAVSLSPVDRDKDRYGRKLRIVSVDGRSVGATLVNEGLARWYAGGRRPWC